MSDKQTPKTFEEFIKGVGCEKSSWTYEVLQDGWSVGTEATRSEYDDKIKAMQAEIDKLKKGLHSVILEHYRNEKINPIPDWSEIEYWQDYLEELNQRGEDE